MDSAYPGEQRGLPTRGHSDDAVQTPGRALRAERFIAMRARALMVKLFGNWVRYIREGEPRTPRGHTSNFHCPPTLLCKKIHNKNSQQKFPPSLFLNCCR